MSNEGGGEQFVVADAQFGISRLLRPFEDFENVYQGRNANRPIMWNQPGVNVDPLAGNAGYAPNLLAGIAVPLGARVIIKFPSLTWTLGQPGERYPYVWDLTWRNRTTRDYRLVRRAYHLPKQAPGAPDTTGIVVQERVYLPAFAQSITYNQVEPAVQIDRVVQNIHAESYRIGEGFSQLRNPPLLADGTEGIYEQGVIDPTVAPDYTGAPSFIITEWQALGDELILGMRRGYEVQPLTWDFAVAGADYGIALGMAATEETGIEVLCGTAP